jgi:hypothetical protein
MLTINKKARKLLSENATKSVALSKWPQLKMVIEGKLYRTETATLIHEACKDDCDDSDPNPRVEQMFRNRLGKFFLAIRNESYWNPAIEEADLQDRIFPLEPAEAINWMEKHCNDKITSFVEVPEAGEPSTTLTLRLDKVLKILIGGAAARKGISLSLWCVQALEAAVNTDGEKDPKNWFPKVKAPAPSCVE